MLKIDEQPKSCNLWIAGGFDSQADCVPAAFPFFSIIDHLNLWFIGSL
jgi:hypothetical protein